MHNGRGLLIEGWAGLNPHDVYGVKPDAMNGHPAAHEAPLTASSGPTALEGRSDKPWHPDSPLFWFGAVLAVTFGLVAASTSIRVGPFKAAISAGK